MKLSNTEKMVLRLVEAKLGSNVQAELYRRTNISWQTHYHIKVKGDLNTILLVKADFGDVDYGITIVKALYTGKNEHLVNLEYNPARWVSIGGCRYANFAVMENIKTLTLRNDDFELVISKDTGDVVSYKNSNSNINYLELFINPSVSIKVEL